MDIRGKSVLILGGYRLVGQAVGRRLLQEHPRELTILSLHRQEAEEATASLQSEAGTAHTAWGDVFAFTDVGPAPPRSSTTTPCAGA
jgi:NAD(P)-dependent dehydrogenase (short-subunit alcohol dehydrogenase family)